MAFNKQKALDAAQKYISQGKLPQAIAEYQQVLRVEPKDSITLMTVGDLFVRTGDTRQALEYFGKLADVFLGDGFNSKAIAIYKKMTKLAPDETKPFEKMAELYVQQGVMSEARPLYLQLAEVHMKAGRRQEAAQVMRSLLDLEPDNIRVQMKLGELYVAMGQPQDAGNIFVHAGIRALERGDAAEATKMAERAAKTDSKNQRAVVLKARALAASGQADEALKVLEATPDHGTGPQTVTLYLDLCLKAGRGARAAEVALAAAERDKSQFPAVIQVADSLVEAGEAERAVELLERVREAVVQSAEPGRWAEVMSRAADRLPGRLEPREAVLEVARAVGDQFRVAQALDQVGEAAEASGNLDRSREALEELFRLKPEDASVRERLRQVRGKLGIATEEAAAPVEEAPPPFAEEMQVPEVAGDEEGLDEETKQFIAQAHTDADLFSTYGQTPKAVSKLEEVLARIPSHTATLEKLLDLHLGAGDEQRTADLAGRLVDIYRQRGDSANADRFEELRRRYQRAATATAAAPAEFSIPVGAPEPPAAAEFSIPAQPAESDTSVHELDLSAEWDAMSSQPAAPPPAEEAPAAEAAAEFDLELAPAAAEPAAKGEAPAMSKGQFLADLASEFDDLELGPPEPAAAAPTAPAAPKAKGKAAAPGAGDPLHGVFEEFRAELGEMEEEKEDLETHYNLGIAYREMGLLEEAIGEFQKVAKMAGAGREFRYVVQCYTLMALAFVEKGHPAVAAMWYQKALETPDLDPESIMALRYDLGVAQEQAGNIKAALDSFTQVYAMNIDYRDVAERIAELEKQR